MIKSTCKVFMIGLSMTLSACSETSEDVNSVATDPAPVEVVETSTYFEDNAKSVREGFFIAGQPKEIDIATFKDNGITHVVNFRTPAEMERLDFDEPELLSKAGITYTSIPLGGEDFPYTPASVTQFTELMKNQDGGVLLHCGSGYRASVVAVAWLVEHEGMPLSEALTHAQGWWPLRLEQVMDTSFTLVPKEGD